MSRNLGRSTCYYCNTDVDLEESPRAITLKEAGVYSDEYRGMRVADAHCPLCHTEYLAWLDKRTGLERDLSFRSTFDDEPGSADIHITRAEQTMLHLKRVIKRLRREKRELKRRRA